LYEPENHALEGSVLLSRRLRMAGYSGTPLPKKLGIKPAHRVAVVGAPSGFEEVLGELPDGVVVANALGATAHDVIVFFVTKQADLQKRFAAIAKRLAHDGGLWIAWPKRSSGVATDVTENTVREVALSGGLVDNKVCAIDDTWSGLRVVYRLKDRPKAKKES
jgi:hypothetical protein